MEIIDVLTLPPAYCLQFTVNTAVNSVDLSRIPTGALSDTWLCAAVSGGARRNAFVMGDSFVVLTMGYVLPDGFCMAMPPANSEQYFLSLALGLQLTITDPVHFLPNFYTYGVMIPMENYEMPANIFVDVNSIGSPTYPYRTSNFHVVGIVRYPDDDTGPLRPQVSMIGVPNTLDGQTFKANIFVKIVHNFEVTF